MDCGARPFTMRGMASRMPNPREPLNGTRERRQRDWTRIGATAAIAALIIAVPAVALAVRELSASTGSRIAGPPAGHAHLSLSPSDTLRGAFAVERKGTSNSWTTGLHGVVPGDVVTWRLSVGDYSDRVDFVHVIARIVLAPHLEAISESVRLDSEEGERQLSDAPAFKGGFDIGDFGPGGSQYLLFDTRLKSDFPGCTVRIRNIAYIRPEGLPETPPASGFGGRRLFADIVIGKSVC